MKGYSPSFVVEEQKFASQSALYRRWDIPSSFGIQHSVMSAWLPSLYRITLAWLHQTHGHVGRSVYSQQKSYLLRASFCLQSRNANTLMLAGSTAGHFPDSLFPTSYSYCPSLRPKNGFSLTMSVYFGWS